MSDRIAGVATLESRTWTLCDVLSLVRVPTLVMQRSEGGGWGVQSGRYLAEHIAGSRFVELPGADFMPGLGDQDPLFAELEGFLADVGEGKTDVETDRVLATVLFTDMIGSSEKCRFARRSRLGRAPWKDTTLLVLPPTSLGSAGLRSIRPGTVFFASFDGPASVLSAALCVNRSKRCRSSVLRCVRGYTLASARLVDGKVAGIAVHTGSRVASPTRRRARCSSPCTVKDLVAGSGLAFDDRGLARAEGNPWLCGSSTQCSADAGSCSAAECPGSLFPLLVTFPHAGPCQCPLSTRRARRRHVDEEVRIRKYWVAPAIRLSTRRTCGGAGRSSGSVISSGDKVDASAACFDRASPAGEDVLHPLNVRPIGQEEEVPRRHAGKTLSGVR